MGEPRHASCAARRAIDPRQGAAAISEKLHATLPIGVRVSAFAKPGTIDSMPCISLSELEHALGVRTIPVSPSEDAHGIGPG